MSFWAYKDISHINSISAEEAKTEDKSINYFCPNPNCPAIMHISHCDGISKARFRALPSHPHIESCEYHRGGYQEDQFEEKSFNFNNALQNLMSNNSLQHQNSKIKNNTNNLSNSHNNNIKALKTLNEIYNVFKAKPINSEYNGIPIISMLADERSSFFYTKGIWGYKIVETNYVSYYKYNNDLNEIKYIICLKYCTHIITHYITLVFNDSKTSKNIQNLLYNNKNKKIIIAANFNTNNTNGAIKITATINSERQIIII